MMDLMSLWTAGLIRQARSVSVRVIAVLVVGAALFLGCAKQDKALPREESAKQPLASAQPAGEAQRDPERLYCTEHECYEDVCIMCHADLREAGRLWCTEHNRYEDRCFLCHPEMKDAQRTYCEKHFLYQDECFMCRPELKDKTEARPASEELMCKEHNVPERECGICHPDLAATLKAGEGLKVRFSSREAAVKGGIETAQPEVSTMADGIECYGEIVFNQNRVTDIAAPVDGVIQTVDTDLGSRVGSGEILATLRSGSIGQSVSEAILAQQTLEREKKLHAEGISSEKDLQEAQAAYRVAYQQLRTLGFSDTQIERLAENPQDGASVAVRSPFAGEVVERHAVRGALIEAGKPLFTLADRSTMWAMLNIHEKSLARVRVGQEVELTVDALPGQQFVGRLTWISAQVDDRTRMALARAEVDNPHGALRAHMFANARILTSHTDRAVIVPSSAIQCLSDRNFVFVKIDDDLYEVRPVSIGAKSADRVEIVDGVGMDDAVVVTGGFVAKSQFLISRLGAGCVDD
jgi:cobalt-zinc-cadmium efflux system membrane fusion protein